MTEVRALWFQEDTLFLLDQRRLPQEVRVLRLQRVEEVAQAIRDMAVRGAPAIGVAASYGMVLASREGRWDPASAGALLSSTRPTAHDLFAGVSHVAKVWQDGGDPKAAAEEYRQRVVGECERIGRVGAPLLGPGARILTHCNAGALATVEWGTALAPIRLAHRAGRDPFVWVDETRPLLQGSRLTAWELQQEGIRHSVIADNAAGYFLQKGDVDLVLVGADRITRSGDFANKIGTYEKAVLARENGVPFYVAAPWSTFDLKMAEGREIPVEERSSEEVTQFQGTPSAPPGSPGRNPAFDITPARFVTGFITPDGILAPSELARVLRERSRDGG
jgi:S-methyl-5-thioribose-1-phosphate isomerase